MPRPSWHEPSRPQRTRTSPSVARVPAGERAAVVRGVPVSPQEALRALRRAVDHFFASRPGQARARKDWLPRALQKGRDDRFRLTGATRVGRPGVKLPRIGGVRTDPPTAKCRGRSAAGRREADRWPAADPVKVERPDAQPHAGGLGGGDLGLKAFAVLSDGTLVVPEQALSRALTAWRRRRQAHANSVGPRDGASPRSPGLGSIVVCAPAAWRGRSPGGVSPPARIQGPVGRPADRGGRPLLPFLADVFRLRHREGGAGLVREPLPVRGA